MKPKHRIKKIKTLRTGANPIKLFCNKLLVPGKPFQRSLLVLMIVGKARSQP